MPNPEAFSSWLSTPWWLLKDGGIRRRMALAFALTTLGVMSLFGYLVVMHERALLMGHSTEHAQAYAHTVAVSSSSWVLAGDVVGLQEVLQSASRMPSLRYAMVLTPEGRVLAATQPEYVGRFVSDAVSRRLLNNTQAMLLVDNDDLVDAASPVMSGTRMVGWVRIGLGRELVTQNINVLVQQSLMVALFALLLVMLVASRVSRRMVLGLEHLVKVTSQVHGGRRDVRAEVEGNDEVGVLSLEFNLMLDALTHYEKEQEQLNRKLRDTEERWRFALEGSGDGVWDWDVAGNAMYFSGRWEQLLGYAPGSLQHHLETWEKLIYPDDLARVMTEFRAHLDGVSTSYISEHRMRNNHGEWVWVLDRGMVTARDETGKPLRMICTMSDISARKLAEAEITRLAQAVEQSPSGVMITDCDGKLEYTNQAYSRITGYQFGQVYGKPLRELISTELDDALYAEIRSSLKVGRSWGGVLANRHSNGKMYWEQVSASPIYDTLGNIISHLYLRQDVTERKAAENALLQRDAALARANADLTRFAEVFAHHLMEPTRRLISYTQLLRPHLSAHAGLLEEDEIGSSLNAIEHDAARLRTLVRDIQLFLAAGEPRGEVRDEDANDALATVKQRLAQRLQEGGGASVNAGQLPHAHIDRPRLMDLFTILLDNALDHARSDVSQQVDIEVAGERVGNTVRYTVSDNGPGIPEPYLERVFTIFEHLGPTGYSSGSGIGLSIARRIVESCGGKIWIENLPQGGAKVIFELPDGE